MFLLVTFQFVTAAPILRPAKSLDNLDDRYTEGLVFSIVDFKRVGSVMSVHAVLAQNFGGADEDW